MNLEQFNITDSTLKTPCVAVENFDVEFQNFCKNLDYTRYKNTAYGIAANQCGFNHAVFCVGNPNIDPTEYYEKNEWPSLIFTNPKIVYFSPETIVYPEGCLSFEDLTLEIERPENIRIRYQTPIGQVFTSRFSGMTARVIQHEFDHLLGLTFKERLSKLKLQSQLKKHQKMKRKLDNAKPVFKDPRNSNVFDSSTE